MKEISVRTLGVCGPTASGKSALGVSLAKALRGEVVNVDSVQVYKGLDIGSAKISEEERAGVPHHLFDVCTPDQQMNAGEYRERAVSTLKEISNRGVLPILVGGSGMYLTVLLQGIADVPATPAGVREAVAELSREEQFLQLQTVDPHTAARLHPNDSQRVSRALEIYRMTGRPPSALFEEHRFSGGGVVALLLVLCRGRDELYDRINDRSQRMMEDGLLAETQSLIETYGEVPVLDTLGYTQARAALKGSLELDAVAPEIALQTRRFAKRQMTYLRNEPVKRGWMIRPTLEEGAIEIAGPVDGSPRRSERSKGFRAYNLSEPELIERIRNRLKAPLERTEVWYVSLR